MKNIILFFFLIASITLYAQPKIPKQFGDTYKQLRLNEKYKIQGYLTPIFLQADFNGDGIPDIAILITEIKTNKKGILLIHGGSNQYFIFGAGTKFGDGSNPDDFKWAGGWKIYKNRIAYEMLFDKDGGMSGSKKKRLNRPAFYIYDLEDGEPNSGGIIYWTSKKYIWIHQGE